MSPLVLGPDVDVLSSHDVLGTWPKHGSMNDIGRRSESPSSHGKHDNYIAALRLGERADLKLKWDGKMMWAFRSLQI